MISNDIQQYVKLENRPVLLAWLNRLLGYRSNGELLEDCKTVAEGFGANGRSFLYHHLIARGNQVRTPDGSVADSPPVGQHSAHRGTQSGWAVHTPLHRRPFRYALRLMPTVKAQRAVSAI